MAGTSSTFATVTYVSLAPPNIVNKRSPCNGMKPLAPQMPHHCFVTASRLGTRPLS
jgi:hypothetical protein